MNCVVDDNDTNCNMGSGWSSDRSANLQNFGEFDVGFFCLHNSFFSDNYFGGIDAKLGHANSICGKCNRNA